MQSNTEFKLDTKFDFILKWDKGNAYKTYIVLKPTPKPKRKTIQMPLQEQDPWPIDPFE